MMHSSLRARDDKQLKKYKPCYMYIQQRIDRMWVRIPDWSNKAHVSLSKSLLLAKEYKWKPWGDFVYEHL